MRRSNFEVINFLAIFMSFVSGFSFMLGRSHITNQVFLVLFGRAVFSMTLLGHSCLDTGGCVVLIHVVGHCQTTFDFLNISMSETIQKVLFIAFETAGLVEVGPVLVIFGARDSLVFRVFD